MFARAQHISNRVDICGKPERPELLTQSVFSTLLLYKHRYINIYMYMHIHTNVYLQV